MQLWFTMLLPCMCQQQISPSNVIYLYHAQITQCASMRQVCYYICNIWTHWHQPHDKECCTQKTIMPMLTMMLQPDCISWVGHWLIQPKILPCITVYWHTHVHSAKRDNNLQFYRQYFCKAISAHPKSVISTPPHHPNVEIIQNQSIQGTTPSQVKLIQNQSLEDHHMLQSEIIKISFFQGHHTKVEGSKNSSFNATTLSQSQK